MGKAARLNRARKQQLQETKNYLQAEHDRISATQEYADVIAAVQDDGTRALIKRDAPMQKARLVSDGWVNVSGVPQDGMGIWDHRKRQLRVIHSLGREVDGEIWGHVSVSHRGGDLPHWYEVRDAQWLFYPEAPGVIVVAPESAHYSVAEVAHVWTKLTGGPAFPDFRHLGAI